MCQILLLLNGQYLSSYGVHITVDRQIQYVALLLGTFRLPSRFWYSFRTSEQVWWRPIPILHPHIG